MNRIKKYLSLIKFSHTIFAMPFAMIGFVLGINFLHNNNIPLLSQENSVKFILVVFCMVSARSAAMAFNRYLDQHIDAKNPRTASREIPAGIIKSKHALLFTVLCCLIFVVLCYFINRLCFYLSFVALFVILFYSYTKRFTSLCHLVLGAGLSLAPIGAFLAVTGVFSPIPVLFSFIVLTWVSGFDIIYSLQDEDFDKSQKLHSIPAWLGKKSALFVSIFLHTITAALISYVGYSGQFSWFYWIGAAIFVTMLVYQHSIVKPHDLSRVNIAFMTANGVASIVFSIFVIIDALKTI